MAKRGEVEPLLHRVLEVVFLPLETAFKFTCPPCEYGSSWEVRACGHRAQVPGGGGGGGEAACTPARRPALSEHLCARPCVLSPPPPRDKQEV
eukprot:SAG22_NODE_906_length_6562_cov_11.249884_8_plen_93_part_00